MASSYGLPLFLIDNTGSLTQSHFEDIYGRIRLDLRQQYREGRFLTAVSTTCPESHNPQTAHLFLDFGPTPQNAEDSWYLIDSTGKEHRVSNYMRVFKGGSNFDRRFTASDGTHCTWRYRKESQTDPGFTLVNDQQYLIAHYLEPSATCSFSEGRTRRLSTMYSNLAGAERVPEGGMLMINDGWEHIADEILAGLTILRHLVRRSQK